MFSFFTHSPPFLFPSPPFSPPSSRPAAAASQREASLALRALTGPPSNLSPVKRRALALSHITAAGNDSHIGSAHRQTSGVARASTSPRVFPPPRCSRHADTWARPTQWQSDSDESAFGCHGTSAAAAPPRTCGVRIARGVRPACTRDHPRQCSLSRRIRQRAVPAACEHTAQHSALAAPTRPHSTDTY